MMLKIVIMTLAYAPFDPSGAADATHGPFDLSTARPPSIDGRLAAGPPSVALRQQRAAHLDPVPAAPSHAPL